MFCSDSLPPPSPRVIERVISSPKPVDLSALITEDSERAYKALVDEGVRSKLSSPNLETKLINAIQPETEENAESEETSPLKLLRRGAGSAIIYKTGGKMAGRPVGGFARSVSQDSGAPPGLVERKVIAVTRSFRETNGDLLSSNGLAESDVDSTTQGECYHIRNLFVESKISELVV